MSGWFDDIWAELEDLGNRWVIINPDGSLRIVVCPNCGSEQIVSVAESAFRCEKCQADFHTTTSEVSNE